MRAQNMLLRSQVVFAVYHRVKELINSDVYISEIYDVVDYDYVKTKRPLSLRWNTIEDYVVKFTLDYRDFYLESGWEDVHYALYED